MTILLTPLAQQYLAERKAEARKIVTGGDEYTPSQRRIAWAVLSGAPPHPKAPASAARLTSEGGAA